MGYVLTYNLKVPAEVVEDKMFLIIVQHQKMLLTKMFIDQIYFVKTAWKNFVKIMSKLLIAIT